MADVIPFPPRKQDEEASPWVLITISQEGPMYRVDAWTGRPTDPESERMMVGMGRTLIEAAEVASLKARFLGIKEIVDFSGTSEPELDGAA